MQIHRAELGELRILLRDELVNDYPTEELNAILNALLSHVTGLTRARMVLESNRVLTESEIFFLQRAVKRLKAHEPLQYITQKAYFRGLEFFVDDRVLIPRPETEELLGWALESLDRDNMRILDIGTGSGCIAVSLKKEAPATVVEALDISPDALEVAGVNAASHKADIRFRRVDILDRNARSNLPKYDLIISNPPYVTPSDRKKMLRNVTEYEPGTALFVQENDPLIFYREIIAFARDHLTDGGKLFFECNESNAREVVDMLNDSSFSNFELRQDLQGKERMVMGVL